jgi:hypothetical protein
MTMQGARAREGGEEEASPQGLSAFAAKVLDQLSLSAWLPAALLSVTLALLLQFRKQDSADLDAALKAISEQWLAVLLLALPVLVLGTLMTQAFSFGAIRALEGYWLRRRPLRWLRELLVRWQASRQGRLDNRIIRLTRRAFDDAESQFADLPPEVVMALRAQAHGLSPLALKPEHELLLGKIDWRRACDPWALARVEDALEAQKEFPARHRILPTRLGNVLRASEDRVVDQTGEDLVTFAYRRRSWLEPRTQRQHDQFRNRLDMYCTLVFVSVAIAALAVALTLGAPGIRTPFVLIASGYAVLAAVAYKAAIGSARGYCTILELMARTAPPA